MESQDMVVSLKDSFRQDAGSKVELKEQRRAVERL